MNTNNLAIVADLMDNWTRDENAAHVVEAQRLEDRIYDMAGEIARLNEMLQARNHLIADMQNEINHAAYVIQSHVVASQTMQRCIAINEQMHPDPNYIHRIAQDHLGVEHLILMERDREVIDLTTEEELSGDETEDELMALLEDI